MQALILAGGKGTRLRPLTVYTPKPIVPICNRPFLLYQIDTLRRAGITDITLSLSYQPNKIEQLLGDGSDHGVKLKYTVEPQPMGTAGAYKFAEDLIREPTVVFNGDILTDLDLKTVIREHTEHGATATIVDVVRPTGGRWIPNFDANSIVRSPWGTLTFTFTDCNNGRVDFNSGLGYGSGSMNLHRLTLPAGLTCP